MRNGRTAIDPVLDNNSWETIRAVSDAGKGENYWRVGDTKTIKINGVIGEYKFRKLKIDVFIIGFNHNSAIEGPNRIHFQIGKINGVDVALCDDEYSYNNAGGKKYFNVNHWDERNYGGWKGCDLRYDILGSTNVPPSGYGRKFVSCKIGYDPKNYDIVNNPVPNTLMAALPSDLRKVMKTVTKYSDNGDYYDYYSKWAASDITQSVDYLFLPAEYEVRGARTYAHEYERDYQAQYDYYKTEGSKIAHNHRAPGLAVWWWLRSALRLARYDDCCSFCRIYANGSGYVDRACGCGGLRPCFCV